jgi:hypothetical protein
MSDNDLEAKYGKLFPSMAPAKPAAPAWNSTEWWNEQLRAQARAAGGSIELGGGLVFTLREPGSEKSGAQKIWPGFK